MAQLQKVSWRTVGYAALGTAVAAASVVAIVNSDGVRPTALTANTATRWLVDEVRHRVVLVDGLAGHVVAGIQIAAADGSEVAVQGAGGAFLVTRGQGSVQPISTPKLQLGAAQTVAVASENGTDFKVGDNGLTIMNATTKEASVIASGDVSRSITIPASDRSMIASDGSMWLFDSTAATHVNVDDTKTSTALPVAADQTTTVGSHAVLFDSTRRVVRWVNGIDVPLDSIPNASEAVLQLPGDDAPCAWLGTGDTLVCVGPDGIDKTLAIDGMQITSRDKLAVADDAAAVIREGNRVERIDLDGRRMGAEGAGTPPSNARLNITATGHLIWIDDPAGDKAWVVHRFDINVIEKTTEKIHLVDEQGHLVSQSGTVNGGNDGGNGGDVAQGARQPQPDNNGRDDPPVANDDSVTARAGGTVTIPVTANDYDPDGGAIAVDSVEKDVRAGHGAVDVLDGMSVTYVPEPGYSGTDSFSYTIIDQTGAIASANVRLELIAPGSPNRAPIARDDSADTRADRAVTIDVLANDTDPERDALQIFRFDDKSGATITETKGPTNLPALRYQPPPGRSGILVFTYQAIDPQGGVSDKKQVTVNVSGPDEENRPPIAKPDSMRLRVGRSKPIDVVANDTDPDGDDLTITDVLAPDGVKADRKGGQIEITLGAGAPTLAHVVYKLSDGAGHTVDGNVLVVKIPDAAENVPPVANPDTAFVVIGNSVLVQVLANDVDPDKDPLSLLSQTQPANGAGTTAGEGNAVRFTPTLTEISEPTPVAFSYTIDDAHGNSATGTVTVTVLAEALPRAPFARDDFADTVVGAPVTIPVLNNDSDPSGDQPTLLGNPSCLNGGEAVRTPDGKVTFTPTGGPGTFRCIYSISNSQGLDAKGSIIVTVTQPQPGNRSPELTTQPLHPVNLGDVLTFRAADLATDADDDTLVFGSIGRSQHGTVTQDSPSAFTYRAPSADSADPAPASDVVEFVISDKNGGNVSGSVSIKINPPAPVPPPPTPPVAPPLALSVFVGEPTPIEVLGAIAPANAGVTLRLVSVTPDVASSASVQQTPTGATVTANTAGNSTISYTVINDATVLSNKGTIRVTAVERPVQNPPPRAVDDALTIASGGTDSVNLLGNDTGIQDPGDATPTIVLLLPLPFGPAFGSVRVENGYLILTAAPRAAGTRRLQYTVDDGSGPSAPATVVLTIEACNLSQPVARSETIFTPYQTPVAIDLKDYVDSGNVRPGSVSGVINDVTGTYTPPVGMNGNAVVNFTVENGCGDTVSATLTIDVNHPPAATTIDRNVVRGQTQLITATDLATDNEPLTIKTIDSDQPWIKLLDAGTPPAALDTAPIQVSPPANTPSGTYSFTATVADPGGLTDVATINVHIANVAPTAVDDAYVTPFSQYTFTPTGNDTDTEPGPLTVLTVVRTSGVGTVLDITGNVVTVAIGHGVTTFDYTIQDSGGLTGSATITITSNHAPTADDVALTFDQANFTVTLTPFDPDIADQGSLVVTCSSTTNLQVQNITPNPNPSSASESDRVDVHIKVLDQAFEGTETIPCTVTDPFGETAVAHLVITIHD